MVCIKTAVKIVKNRNIDVVLMMVKWAIQCFVPSLCVSVNFNVNFNFNLINNASVDEIKRNFNSLILELVAVCLSCQLSCPQVNILALF
jgi:hypothetical protein